MGKASVNFRHEWLGRLLAVHYGCRISILIILKQTSSEGPSGTNGSSFYYSSLAGIEDVIRRAAGLGPRGDGCLGRNSLSLPRLGRAEPGSPWATAAQAGKDTEVNQGQHTKTWCHAPTTEASADQVLIKIFMHQHCCLNLPLSAPSPLSSPMMDTASLEHFWKKMLFFYLVFVFNICFGKPWWDVNLKLPELASHLEGTRMMCVISHIIKLSLTQSPPPTYATPQQLPGLCCAQ